MKIYAKAEKVPKECKYITEGKLYEVFEEFRGAFKTYNENGPLIALWESCPHLSGGNWTRIEAGTLEELNLKEGDVIQCVKNIPCGWAATEGCSWTVEEDGVIWIPKEDWHEVKHLFTIVKRAEENKEMEEELFAGKFNIGDKIHLKWKNDGWNTEDKWQQRIYTVVSNKRAEHEDGESIGSNPVIMEYKLAEEDKAEQPKKWKDLTDAEKGALLLAHHKGKPIEVNELDGTWRVTKAPAWQRTCCYRVKPSPVIEEKEEKFGWNPESGLFLWLTGGPQFKLKYRLVDGKLDEDSVKVVPMRSTKEKC